MRAVGVEHPGHAVRGPEEDEMPAEVVEGPDPAARQIPAERHAEPPVRVPPDGGRRGRTMGPRIPSVGGLGVHAGFRAKK